MNESQLEQFLAHAVESLQQKNDLLERQHGIGRFARWNHDGDLGRLTFSNRDDANVLFAETTDIGSYSLKTKTWMWAWANQSLTLAAQTKAEHLKRLFETTGMRVFTDAHVDCDEYLAWELAAASVQQLDGLGCYRGPAGHLWIFWSIDSVAMCDRS